jgi:hypothetical protein
MMTMAIGAAVSMAPLHAQKTTQTSAGTGGSPHVKTEWTIDGADIVVEYGRPYLKGRPESQLMPPGQPWRMGADQPTLLTTNKPLKVGTLTLAPGTYTLNAIAGPSSWQLLVGKYEGPSQWGIPYQPALEIGRAPMTLARTTAPVEQVTIHIDDTAAGATLRVEWGTASATTPFTVG